MRMNPDGLRPTVKAGNSAGQRAEVFRILQQFLETLPRRLEQQLGENLSVELPHTVQFPWDSEDRVVVIAIRQTIDLFMDPPADFHERADRTEPVFAGVVPDLLDMTFRTALHMPAEFRRAALAYRASGLDDMHRKLVTRPMRLEMLLEHILDDRFHAEPEFSTPSSSLQALSHHHRATTCRQECCTYSSISIRTTLSVDQRGHSLP